MAKKPTSYAGATGAWLKGPDGQFETLSEMTGKNFEIAQTAGQAMLEGALGMGQEAGAFVSARLKKDVEAAQAIAGCRTFADVCRMQADFLGDTMRDYAEQTSRMLHMGADAAADTVDAVSKLEPVANLADMTAPSGGSKTSG